MRRFLLFIAFFTLSCGLFGCSRASSPYPRKSASWFAKTRHTKALQAELTWCAENDPNMKRAACAQAKRGYERIGGQWNSMTIGLFKSGAGSR